MNLRGYIPKTLGDCIACIIDLAKENEELKGRLDKCEAIKKKIQSFNEQTWTSK